MILSDWKRHSTMCSVLQRQAQPVPGDALEEVMREGAHVGGGQVGAQVTVVLVAVLDEDAVAYVQAAADIKASPSGMMSDMPILAVVVCKSMTISISGSG